METTVGHETEVEHGKVGSDVKEYRDAVRKLIETEVRNAIDEEMRKAAQELLEEQRKAIRQMVEEHKAAIKEAVEEEKKAIWTRVEELKKSILKLRFDIIRGYGGKCECCGESNPYFLTIHHRYNDGHIERKQEGWQTTYRRLRRENFPRDKYQLLCFNCNCSKNRQRKL